jgi:hypothetical protein
MSETAETIISSALLDIGVRASESPLEPDEYADAMRYLNRMMASYAVEGVNIGYTRVSTLADPITVPDGAIDGMIANLAIRLHPQFAPSTDQISLALAQAAEDGKIVLLSLGIDSIGPTAFPDTLPIGSGNQDGFIDNQYFYTGDLDDIESEEGGFIATEGL